MSHVESVKSWIISPVPSASIFWKNSISIGGVTGEPPAVGTDQVVRPKDVLGTRQLCEIIDYRQQIVAVCLAADVSGNMSHARREPTAIRRAAEIRGGVIRALSSRKRTKTQESTQATATCVIRSARHSSNVTPVRSAARLLVFLHKAFVDLVHVVAARRRSASGICAEAASDHREVVFARSYSTMRPAGRRSLLFDKFGNQRRLFAKTFEGQLAIPVHPIPLFALADALIMVQVQAINRVVGQLPHVGRDRVGNLELQIGQSEA